MSAPQEPESRPDGVPGPVDAPMADSGAPPARTGRLWPWAVGAGLGAGLASWLVGEAVVDAYRAQLAPPSGMGFPPPEAKLALIATRKTVAAIIFAAQGGLLGVVMGIAGGGSRGSAAAAMRAALAGLVLGAVAGGLAATGLAQVYYTYQDIQDDTLLIPLLTHLGIAAAAGLAGGVALGVGLGGRVGQTLAGGLMGAAGGAVLYELAGAIAFPTGGTSDPIPGTATTRLILHLAVTTLAAVGAAWSYRAPARRRPKPSPPAG